MKEQLFCTLIGKMRLTTYFVYYLEIVSNFSKAHDCKTTKEWIIESCLPDIIKTVDSLHICDTHELKVLDAIINLTINELEQCDDSNIDYWEVHYTIMRRIKNHISKPSEVIS